MELKNRMTFAEMEQYMTENTPIIPSRVTVGKYAKELGFKVYRPMVNGRVMFYYINNNIKSK